MEATWSMVPIIIPPLRSIGVILFSTFPSVRSFVPNPRYRSTDFICLPILIKLGHNIPIGELRKPIAFGWIILKNGRSAAILNCKISRFSTVTALQVTFFDRFQSNLVTIYLLGSLGSLLFLVGLFWKMDDRRPFWIVKLAFSHSCQRVCHATISLTTTLPCNNFTRNNFVWFALRQF